MLLHAERGCMHCQDSIEQAQTRATMPQLLERAMAWSSPKEQRLLGPCKSQYLSIQWVIPTLSSWTYFFSRTSFWLQISFVVFLPIIHEPMNEQNVETWNSPVNKNVSTDLILTRPSQQGYTRLVLYFSVSKNTHLSTLAKATDWMFYKDLW